MNINDRNLKAMPVIWGRKGRYNDHKKKDAMIYHFARQVLPPPNWILL